MGAVSSSGYGDGGYSVYVRTNEQGQAVVALLAYIGEPNEEDESAEEDESID